MSPKLASVGFSTAAEAAWFDQEVTPEPGFLDRPTSQRRMLIVFAAAFLVIGSVLGVARAAVGSSTGRASAAAAPVAPAPLALAAKKPAPAPLAAPRVAVAPKKSTARAIVAKATKKPVHKAPAKKKSKRPARHR